VRQFVNADKARKFDSVQYAEVTRQLLYCGQVAALCFPADDFKASLGIHIGDELKAPEKIFDAFVPRQCGDKENGLFSRGKVIALLGPAFEGITVPVHALMQDISAGF
jgi:hypothetical protein